MTPPARSRPRLRGVSHKYAFFASLGPSVALAAAASGPLARTAAIVYACAVGAMFGTSALYHRVTWPSAQIRQRVARLDHATVYLMIAGSYTPLGLLVLKGSVRAVVLALVWGGALAAIALKTFWVDLPKAGAAVAALLVGGVGLVCLPQLLAVGAAGFALLLAAGACFAAGAVVYALRRPDPLPTVFGYHEVFHALVVVAVALQYVGLAFWVVR